MQDITHANVPIERLLTVNGKVSNRTNSNQGGDLLVQHLVLQQPAPTKVPRFIAAKLRDFESDYSSLTGYQTTLAIETHLDRLELIIATDQTRVPNLIAENMLRSLTESVLQVIARRPANATKNLADDSLHWSDRLPIPAVAESLRRETRLSNYTTNFVAPSFMESFARQVAANPDAKAIEATDGSLSFQSLDQRSAQIADWLVTHGYGDGSRVGVMLNRNVNLLPVLIGIWKAGAAYIPLDKDYPVERLKGLIADSAPNGILMDDSGAERLDAISTACPTIDIQRLIDDEASKESLSASQRYVAANVRQNPTSLAYLIYTSGSTGKPKGVAVEQRNIGNFLNSMSQIPGMKSGERLLASTTTTFDISLLEMFLPLVTGGTCVLSPQAMSEDPEAVLEFIRSRRIDILQSTPSSFRLLLALGWKPSPQQRLLCGGEALTTDLSCDLLATAAELWNMYGPTETTVWSSVSKIDRNDRSPISIGTPVKQTIFRIVGEDNRIAPEGMIGELWIGGDGTARGYWNRKELTSDRFVVGDSEGRIFYKTGDLARLTDGGRLEILGRRDRQIKLLGHRIELGEIEQAILNHPWVSAAAALTTPVGESDPRIVAFYVTEAGRRLVPDDLRDYLQKSLPMAMIPASIVPITSMPMTPAGKIDYQVLPMDHCTINVGLPIDRSGTNAADTKADPIEDQISELWKEVLAIGQVTLDDHFFHFGGHSLKAAQLFSRLRALFDIDLPLKEIYTHPTVRQLAVRVRSLLLAQNEVASTPAPQAEPTQADVLSTAEQRLWFVDRLEPNHPFYNLPLAARIEGPLDLRVLEASFSDVIARHETLRSTYRLIDGKPIRDVHPFATASIRRVDLSELSDREFDAQLADQIEEEARQPFSLERAPLVRITAFKGSTEQHVILLVMHHIISDGWSMSVMLSELAECYRARRAGSTARLPVLTKTYRQYAIEERRRIESSTCDSSLAHWETVLVGSTHTIDLPTDFDRPAVQDFDGSTCPFEVPEELTKQVLELSRRYDATPFMVMMAAYGVLLSRYANQADFNVGTAVANRGELDLESLIGFFVGTIVLRIQTNPELTFEELLSQVRTQSIESLAHQDVPFERLVERFADQRDRSHSPLFQVAMVMQNTPRDFQTADELTIDPVHVDNGTAKYDLTLFLWEQDRKLVGHFEYRTRLFKAETISQMGCSMRTLLGSIIAAPEATIESFELLDPALKRKIEVRSFGPLVDDDSPELLHELVATRVGRFQANPAISDNSIHWTYQDLEDRAQVMATGLQNAGLQSGQPIVHWMTRSANQVAAQLATLKSGGFFVPVDSSVPLERIETLLAEVEGRFILVDDDLLEIAKERLVGVQVLSFDSVLEDAGKPFVSPLIQPSDLAYMIFTSGSTGKPKGVGITHRSICNFVQAFCERVELDSTDRFLYSMSPSFDGALSQSFTALAVVL